MARIFITGSADGLGSLSAKVLIEQGHRVVLHAPIVGLSVPLGSLKSKNDSRTVSGNIATVADVSISK
jgi:REP element-mobilizing transposase RayT